MHANLLDAVLLGVFALAVWDGARRGLSPYLAELGAFVLSIGLAFALFGPIVVGLSRVMSVPANAAGVAVFLLVLVAAHGLAWPSFRHAAAAAERRLRSLAPDAPVRRLGALPALGTALVGAAVVLSALTTLPGQGQVKGAVEGSAIGARLAAAAAVLPVRSLLGESAPGGIAFDSGQGAGENAFYHLSLPSDLKLSVDTAAEARMLNLLNATRRQNGLRPLTMDPQLQAAARDHSRDMYVRRYFSHVTPDGKDAFTRLRSAGIQFLAAGENIAFAPNVDQGESSLLQSPEHRANILAPDYVRVGIGVIRAAGYEEMFTQEFADAG